MEITKSIALTCVEIIAFAISLIIAQLLIRKERQKSESEGKTNLSFGILFGSWIISISQINYKLINTLNEIYDITFKTNEKNQFLNCTKSTVLFMGVSLFWLIFIFSLTRIINKIFSQNRDNCIEIENNNYVYFLIQGLVFIGMIYCSMPILDILLKYFFPEIEIPYFR